MKKNERVMWAVGVVLADLLVFVMPVFAILFAYLILARPAWFKNWIDDLYSGE